MIHLKDKKTKFKTDNMHLYNHLRFKKQALRAQTS